MSRIHFVVERQPVFERSKPVSAKIVVLTEADAGPPVPVQTYIVPNALIGETIQTVIAHTPMD